MRPRKAEADMCAKGKRSSVKLDWVDNTKHVTLMPVVSADDSFYNSLSALFGARTKYPIREDEIQETPVSRLSA